MVKKVNKRGVCSPERPGYIYIIENKVNGNVYVGQSIYDEKLKRIWVLHVVPRRHERRRQPWDLKGCMRDQ